MAGILLPQKFVTVLLAVSVRSRTNMLPDPCEGEQIVADVRRQTRSTPARNGEHLRTVLCITSDIELSKGRVCHSLATANLTSPASRMEVAKMFMEKLFRINFDIELFHIFADIKFR
jgi:hypothetical protein